MCNFKNGICKFIGDWKTLKSLGFRYNRFNSVIYFYEGTEGQHKYSSTHIQKVGGILHLNQLTGCAYQLLEFIKNDLKGAIPQLIYVDMFHEKFYTEDPSAKSPEEMYDNLELFRNMKIVCIDPCLTGLDVLYGMYLEGNIVHEPKFKLH
ncbi:hypothetical protein NVP1101O_166 [Vibrio phage 1.101.O._10N.261.45.C6]|nr:hypothetical protein NVP1101O_166 [Vibrio phage 1.101.O._10N.261.45.C6]